MVVPNLDEWKSFCPKSDEMEEFMFLWHTVNNDSHKKIIIKTSNNVFLFLYLVTMEY